MITSKYIILRDSFLTRLSSKRLYRSVKMAAAVQRREAALLRCSDGAAMRASYHILNKKRDLCAIFKGGGGEEGNLLTNIIMGDFV